MKKNLFEIGLAEKQLGDLRGKYKNEWAEESFGFENSIRNQMPEKRTNNFVGIGANINRIKMFLILAIIVIALISGRIFYLQIVRGDDYRSLAEGNRVRMRPILAERGIILDSKGKELVSNVPSFSLLITPHDLPMDQISRDEILKKIAVESGISFENLVSLLAKYGSYSYESLIIKDNLDHDTAMRLYLESSNLPGVLVETGTKRGYYVGSSTVDAKLSMSHVLGYVGKITSAEAVAQENSYLSTDNIGKVGLEKMYEQELRGVYGRKKIEVDALGRERSILAQENPVAGKNLHITIDIDAQQKLEEIMVRHMKLIGKQRAAAIAMDPSNGAVIALVSLPSYNNNDFSGGIDYKSYQKYLEDTNLPLFDRVIAGTYPSGSTVKMVVAAAALQEGVITANTTISSVGGINVGKWFFKDWLAGGHGATNVTKALSWSVNTFFYYVGGGYKSFSGLGEEKLLKYMYKFNISKLTNIDLPGEKPGFLPNSDWKYKTKGEQWYIGDTYNLSIGQGDLLVTPLQVAEWTTAIANGGKIVWPHIGDYFVDSTSKEKISLHFPVKTENFVSPENIVIVKNGMRSCVTSGSCKLLNGLPFGSGGKTGTAQWSKGKPEHAWFTGFAPYNNPKVVVTVLVEEGGEGSRASMPIVNEFLRWYGAENKFHE